MRETERQPDPAGLGAPGQRLVGAIAVDLHHAGEAVALLRNDRLAAAAGGEHVSRSPVAPAPAMAGRQPRAPKAGTCGCGADPSRAPAMAFHRRRCAGSHEWYAVAGHTALRATRAARSTQCTSVERSSVTPWPARGTQFVSGRLSGMCQANFETTTQATSAVDAMPAVINRDGAGACAPPRRSRSRGSRISAAPCAALAEWPGSHRVLRGCIRRYDASGRHSTGRSCCPAR